MFILLFFGIWLAFNANITLEICIFGAVFAVALYLFMWKAMKYNPRYDLNILILFPWIIKYLLVLLWEIVKANFGVIGFILSTKKIEPKLAYFTTTLVGDVAKTALANSITLTPGTIIVSNEDDLYCIHALDKSMVDGLNDSVFTRQLDKMERILHRGEERIPHKKG